MLGTPLPGTCGLRLEPEGADALFAVAEAVVAVVAIGECCQPRRRRVLDEGHRLRA